VAGAPARRPSCACSGKMWPGCTRSAGLASRRHRRLHWCARGRRRRCRWSRPWAASMRDREGGAVRGAGCRAPSAEARAARSAARERQADEAAAEAAP
jgi:hypothetical protein